MANTAQFLCVTGLVCGFAALGPLACSAEGTTLPGPTTGSDAGATESDEGSGATGAADQTGSGGAGTTAAGGTMSTVAIGGTTAMMTVVPSAGGTVAVLGSGGAVTAAGGTTTTTTTATTTPTGSGGSDEPDPPPAGDGNSGLIPADGGNFVKDWNGSGVIGSWYVYEDEGGSTITPTYPDPNDYGPFGNENGEFCFSGTAVGHNDEDYATNWGVGIGMDVCAFPEDMSWLPSDLATAAEPEQKFFAADCPTSLTGVNSITFTVTGNVGGEFRVGFKTTESDDDVSPFIKVVSDGTYTMEATDALVPDDWEVPNPGATGSSNIVAIQFGVASQTDDESFDFCISNVTIN